MAQSPSLANITLEYFQQVEAESLPIAPLLGISLTRVGFGWARACARYQDSFTRPGGTVAGPVMMALADYVAFAAVLTHIGPVELAVTSNLNINFLSKPEPTDLIAHADVLRVGRRLAYVDVQIFSKDHAANELTHTPGDDHSEHSSLKKPTGLLVAQSSVIYAIPA